MISPISFRQIGQPSLRFSKDLAHSLHVTMWWQGFSTQSRIRSMQMAQSRSFSVIDTKKRFFKQEFSRKDRACCPTVWIGKISEVATTGRGSTSVSYRWEPLLRCQHFSRSRVNTSGGNVSERAHFSGLVRPQTKWSQPRGLKSTKKALAEKAPGSFQTFIDQWRLQRDSIFVLLRLVPH